MLQVQGKSVIARIFINALVGTHGVCPLRNLQCPGIVLAELRYHELQDNAYSI